MTTVLLVRHGLTATTGHVLTGWTPGIPLDDRGQAQAAALAARLAALPLDAIVSSPLERCQQTAAAIAATRDGQQVITEDRVVPGIEMIAGRSYGQAPRLPEVPSGWASRPSPPLAEPAPLVFPPGSGVRFTIGRTRDCDLCLTDLSVSRMHALLVRREDGWVLSDLGSHNGTRLNGWLVREPVQVRAGDRVEFGSMAFIIQGDPEPPPSGPEEQGLTGTGPEGTGPSTD